MKKTLSTKLSQREMAACKAEKPHPLGKCGKVNVIELGLERTCAQVLDSASNP